MSEVMKLKATVKDSKVLLKNLRHLLLSYQFKEHQIQKWTHWVTQSDSNGTFRMRMDEWHSPDIQEEDVHEIHEFVYAIFDDVNGLLFLVVENEDD